MTEYNAIIFKSGDQWRLIPAEVVKEVYTAKTNFDVYVGVQEAKDKSLPIVNEDEIWTVIKRPGIESRFYEWPGTWEKVYGIDFGGNDFAFGTGAKLIAPQQPQAEDKIHCGGSNCPFEYSCVDRCMYPNYRKISMTQADKANEGREEKPAKKWLDKFGLHSRKNHGINAHLKPRLYFVKYEDAEQVIETLTKQLANQMQDYHDKIAKLINEKSELRDQLSKEREETIRECIGTLEKHHKSVGTGDEYSKGIANAINLLHSLIEATELDKNKEK